jgi:hypothetical protein
MQPVSDEKNEYQHVTHKTEFIIGDIGRINEIQSSLGRIFLTQHYRGMVRSHTTIVL